MITCFKHKVNFNNGKCPACVREIEGVSVSYSTSDPIHKSNYIQDKVDKLNRINKEIEKINNTVKSILEHNKD